jgi:hypothetical protein
MNIRLTFSFLFVLPFLAFAQVPLPDTLKNGKIAADTNIIPVLITGGELQDDEAQNQDISGLLQSSRDVFTSLAGFNFSVARYRFRGYEGLHTQVLLGGMPVNDPETGMAIFAYWGGLNDITRYPETKAGISSSHHAFGGVGGYSAVNLDADDFRKGTRVSYAATNRTYYNRAMITHSTGLLKSGWAFTLSASGRWSKEGYVDGTYYSGASYYAGATKKLNEAHDLNFILFGAPTVQARQGIAIQEAYDLTENPYYNPFWGYQNGEKRNARVRNNHVPFVIISDKWKINDKSTLATSAYFVYGRTGNTNLNWYDAADPRPDYYRRFPSYFNTIDQPGMAVSATENWQNDVNTQQINWDYMIFANSKNLHMMQNANGVEGNNVVGNRAKYIVEEYRVDPRRGGIYSLYNLQLNDKTHITAGFNAYKHVSKNFRVLKDLLGADYWVDLNQFAERDLTTANAGQNDLSTPNKIIGVGDRFSYDYDIHVNYQEAFGNIEYKIKSHIDGYAGLSLSHTGFWREGNLQNGAFPDNSLGESDKQNFNNYMIKAGWVYKITGRHMITLNGMYGTKAPMVANAFTSPRTRNEIVANLSNIEVLSGDINYIVRYPKLKARVSAFYTEINNQTWARSFYHDEYRTFVNYMMYDMDQLFMGIEAGVEHNITSTWQVNGAFTTAEYLYSNRPKATIVRDNSREVVAEERIIYLQNYKIGGMPQTAGTVGVKYSAAKFWWIAANFNYLADIYLDPNPDRRTEDALSRYVSTDPQVAKIIDQVKLDNGYTVNLSGGKSWRIKKYNSFLRLNVNINNLLNNRSFVTGGFEQLRYDAADIDRFPPKLGYAFGLNYFVMLTYQF